MRAAAGAAGGSGRRRGRTLAQLLQPLEDAVGDGAAAELLGEQGEAFVNVLELALLKRG